MKKTSLAVRVFICFAVFLAVILLLLWLSEGVFLDKIYKSVKISQTKEAAAAFTEIISGEDYSFDDIDEAARKYNTCIIALKLGSEKGEGDTLAISRHVDTGCDIHDSDGEPDSLLIFNGYYKTLYDKARSEGGQTLERFGNMEYDSESGEYIMRGENESGKESVFFAKITEGGDGYSYFMILNTVISPLTSTVSVLSVILIIISVAMGILAVVLAVILSKKISKPIVALTKEAGKLGDGSFSAKFEGDGYREVDDLAEVLNNAQAELGRTDEYRRELIANISHDLRTPITMIGGYAEAMRDIPGENTPENVQIIIDESKRLSMLVNEVLDISKLQSGVGNFELSVFSLTGAVKETIERIRQFTEKDGYIIDFEYEEELSVCADREKILQTVYNLVGNALSYTGEDKRVVVRQSLAEDGFVRLDFCDSGEGIPQDKLEYIWDRYYKVGGDHKRAVIGSGLGLSIVKEIMKISGGRCRARSIPGEGSVFTIELPLYNAINRDDNE